MNDVEELPECNSPLGLGDVGRGEVAESPLTLMVLGGGARTRQVKQRK